MNTIEDDGEEEKIIKDMAKEYGRSSKPVT